MDYQTIIYDKGEGISRITLNRPDVLNSFTMTMHREFHSVLSDAEDDPEVRVVVITGAGRAFSAGADLKEILGSEGTLPGTLDMEPKARAGFHRNIAKIVGIPKPVIASVNGVAAGGGCGVALACDLRIASEKACFIQAFVRVGLSLDSGTSYFLPRLIGLTKATEIAFTGDTITATDAERLGLVNRVVPMEELETTTDELAQRFVDAPTKAIGFIKQSLKLGANASLEEILDFEAKAVGSVEKTEDACEGIKAFLEKRTPNFKGR